MTCLNHRIATIVVFDFPTSVFVFVFDEDIDSDEEGTGVLVVEVCPNSCHNTSQSSNHPSKTKTETEGSK